MNRKLTKEQIVLLVLKWQKVKVKLSLYIPGRYVRGIEV